MSLTSLLQDPQSPERAYLDHISPLLEASSGRSDGSRAAADALGLTQLARSRTVVSPFQGADGRLAGTAFDFRARIELGGFDPLHSVAAAGVGLLATLVPSVENGSHRTRILAEAFDVAIKLLQEPYSDSGLDRAALLLAYCEQVARKGAVVMNGSLGTICDQAADGQSFADRIDPRTLGNIRSLMSSSADQLEAWQEQIAIGVRYEPNPGFAGSVFVGGADADWMIGETLIDCKVYSTLTVSKLRDFLRQLLGYVMLDSDDSLGIRRVGIWLPRQRLMPSWSLTHLLGGKAEELLPSLREEFIKATAKTQLARQAPIPERRRHQLLADNRYTSFERLADLAESEDPDIRRRVGRNESTPEPTVRMLAGDARWQVRQGIATNRKAPEDVLKALARDRSVAVRRAAAANPCTPRPQLKAVTADISGNGDQDAKAADGGRALAARATAEANWGTALDQNRAHISCDRDESALETTWFWDFLQMVGGHGQLSIPRASYRWGWEAGRKLGVEEWMWTGLPDDVLTDLIGANRPAWVRREAARKLPISDADVRTSLLSDLDPEIRWLTLERSVRHQGDDLTAFLADLAASREARLRFRTAGSGARREWRYTAADYERQTLRVIAAHPSTPYGTLLALTDSPPEVLASLVENPTLKAEDRARLVQLLQASRSVTVREMLASLGSAPETTLIELASDRDARVRAAVARHHATPPSTLTRLAGDSHRAVQTSVLENPNSPSELAKSIAESLLLADTDEDLLEVLGLMKRWPDIDVPPRVVEGALDRLSKSRRRDPDMRLVVAGDERSGEKTLSRLGRSADDDIRREVASNPRTSDAVMEQLAGDPEPSVRASVAANPRAPATILERLSHDQELLVRAGAAGNPRLPQRILLALLIDSESRVRSVALKNPAAPEELVREAEAELALTRQRTGPDRAALERMVADKSAKVRTEVAFSPAADADLLRMLGGERPSTQVHRAVAANPNTPSAVLRSLAGHNDTQVRQAVAFNSATPPDLLIELAGRSIDLAVLVAMNPDVPREVLGALGRDSSPLVRFVAKGYLRSRGVLSSGTTPTGPAGSCGARLPDNGGPPDDPDSFPGRIHTSDGHRGCPSGCCAG
ncbi:hypothetical protein MOD31_18620 [Paenarthrobacter sp. TYUT067]|uniref:hypothetical protein n=1 Tax=Paenarthrobacter sp. TYUT067 TaxID=2926245 RepID=UPI002030039D|nr:hypothetical protein [Paenarthrobacter sp. TYUT067]MCM0618042.1 hypothetical protein [Paenarthrobacter sp. TYUT067]